MAAVAPPLPDHARVLIAVALAVFTVAGCFRPSVSDLNHTLDTLHAPATWRVAGTRTYGPGGNVDCNTLNSECPTVTRYYVASGDTGDAYRAAVAMVKAAGYDVDTPESVACRPIAGLPACSAVVTRTYDGLVINVFAPGHTFTDVAIPPIGSPVVAIAVYAK